MKMFNIYKIENNKLVQMFGKSYSDYDVAITALSFWYEVKRNDRSAQFLVINQEDKMAEYYNYSITRYYLETL